MGGTRNERKECLRWRLSSIVPEDSVVADLQWWQILHRPSLHTAEYYVPYNVGNIKLRKQATSTRPDIFALYLKTDLKQA